MDEFHAKQQNYQEQRKANLFIFKQRRKEKNNQRTPKGPKLQNIPSPHASM